jgi:hypothetical protein
MKSRHHHVRRAPWWAPLPDASRAAASPQEAGRLLVYRRARSDCHHVQATTRPAIDDAVPTDPCGPETIELPPQWLPDLGSVSERIDHRADLLPLVRMGGSDHARGREAERYLARAADRFFPRGASLKTFS